MEGNLEINQLNEQKKEFEPKIVSVVKQSNDLVITSEADLEKASYMIKSISDLKNSIDKTRKSITDPIYKSYKNANEFFNQFLNPLKQADIIVRQKASEYRTRQEQERMEKQKKLDELFRKDQERLNRKAEKLGIEAPVILAPTVQENPEKVGATKFKKVWAFDITDISKVPVEYLMVDLAKVRKFMYEKTNVGETPEMSGIKFYQKDQVSL